MDITKESEALLCCMYKIYLERRKNGIPRDSAKEFEDGFHKSDKKLSKKVDSDISACLRELEAKGYIRTDILDNAVIEDSTIVYMENRFKNGLMEVIEFVTHFLP